MQHNYFLQSYVFFVNRMLFLKYFNGPLQKMHLFGCRVWYVDLPFINELIQICSCGFSHLYCQRLSSKFYYSNTLYFCWFFFKFWVAFYLGIMMLSLQFVVLLLFQISCNCSLNDVKCAYLSFYCLYLFTASKSNFSYANLQMLFAYYLPFAYVFLLYF
jgi:hypothetical protein